MCGSLVAAESKLASPTSAGLENFSVKAENGCRPRLGEVPMNLPLKSAVPDFA